MDLQGIGGAKDEAVRVAVGRNAVIAGDRGGCGRGRAGAAPLAGDGQLRWRGHTAGAGRKAHGHRTARGNVGVIGGRANGHVAVLIVQAHPIPQTVDRTAEAEGQLPVAQGLVRGIGQGDVAFQARAPVLDALVGYGQAVQGGGGSGRNKQARQNEQQVQGP
jgi:hypothetical protein